MSVFAHSCVQHIFCCVSVLCVFLLCTLFWQFLWNLHFLLPLRYLRLFLLTIVLSVLRFMTSDYPFGIFQTFLQCLWLIKR